MQIKTTSLIIFILFLLITGCAAQKNTSKLEESRAESSFEAPKVEFDVKKHVLSNGLTVLLVKRDRMPIFSYYTFYKVGSKFEPKGMTGSSHFLEHMMFKGAKKYGPGDFDRLIEGNGGSNNAYTTQDLTVYYENLPSEYIAQIIDIEADRMQHLLLEKDSFEKERNVVLEERKMRYENSDRGKLQLNMLEKMYVGTPYGTSVIGEIDDIKNVSRDEVQKYFKRYYSPNNAVIVIVGDINRDSVLSEIQNKFGNMTATSDLEKNKTIMMESRGGHRFKKLAKNEIALKGTSVNPSFLMGFRGHKVGVKESLILDLLTSIIGEGASSHLQEKLIYNQHPTMSQVYAFNYPLQDNGIFLVGGQFLSKTSSTKGKNELWKALKSSCSESITKRNLEKVKNRYLTSFFQSLETNDQVAKLLGNSEVYYGDYNYYLKEFELYEKITTEEIVKTCKDIFKDSNALYLTISANN